jgi:uncharacterized protein
VPSAECRRLTLLVLPMMPLFLLGRPAHAGTGPSFDCNRAQAADELAICSNAGLSEMDNLIAAGYEYASLKFGKARARRLAATMLRLRSACGGDTSCILQRQVEAVKAYQQLGAPLTLPAWLTNQTAGGSDGLPTAIGQCVRTRITGVTGRFGEVGQFDSGTAVSYANGGSGVSYEKEWPVIRSRAGDEVELCLVSVPENCPPGDDRGKVYRGTNLRTHESWELPDSQHSCGGA